MSGGGVRVSIPSNVRKMIQNIKEITGNHSEEEIYAMLKDCSMDPNETAQKLLFQDPFHEVKKKRDRRKENVNNRESGEARWKPGTQGRGSRGGRPNFSARYTSHDAGGGRNTGPARDNGTNQAAEKGDGNSLPAPQEKTYSSAAVVANGAIGEPSGSNSEMHASDIPSGSGRSQHEVTSTATAGSKFGSSVSPINADKNLIIASGTGDAHSEPIPSSSNSLVPATPPSSSAVCFSSSDPVLVPSNDSRLSGTVGTIKREVGNHRAVVESNTVIPAEKSASEIATPSLQGKIPSKSQVGKGQLSESLQSSSASNHGGSSGSRPSSNYSSRSQQVVGLQKVGSTKEWKPKPAISNVPLGSGTGSSDAPNIPVEPSVQSQALSNVLSSEEATSKLQKKLEELHLPQRQHVIIPNHIHVPESERTKFSFGSFDASFGLMASYVSGPESDKSSTPLSETSQGIEEAVEEQAVSNQDALLTAEEEADHPESPSHAPENLPGDNDVSSSAVPECNESKPETALLSGVQPYSVVHTSPSYNFGFAPPMLSSQTAPFENCESQERDVSRLPSFVVQQPFDPTSYYAQFYRAGADSDGRVSPFPSAAVAGKYNGNVAVLPPHSSQSPQEGGNSLVLSTAGPTPQVTQAGLMQSSIAVTQQPLPVFRPPTGLHIPHYPPNLIPYGHYFSPFYVPSPGLHQFLSNGAFPQQPQAGSLYPAPPAAAAMGIKYSLPQYKPGSNTGNSTHIGMASGYGSYGSSQTGYSPSSAATGGNSTTNEDLGAPQFKESNVYITGQQSEGSAVWIAAPGRDISSLPASSFYSLPPQGQHVTFTPAQAGHGTFASIYQPAQAVTAAAVHPLLQQSQAMAGAVDMVGPAASVYQQPQHQQINWPSNY
ncbi:GBF-interacting protein 1-like isoform X3 [Manihot esculenta]|uniref:GBF-interacting protein 1-like isoform X3 n=1 Tax=Manihot esculenta TaxID=3983 RepID=UPI000B5D17A7|nr:GBF-interacting protein 1-like isoform X3 [Manihot esculenta]